MPQHGAEPSLSAALGSTPRGLPARVHLAQVTQTKREGTLGIDSLIIVVVVVVVVLTRCQ